MFQIHFPPPNFTFRDAYFYTLHTRTHTHIFQAAKRKKSSHSIVHRPLFLILVSCVLCLVSCAQVTSAQLVTCECMCCQTSGWGWGNGYHRVSLAFTRILSLANHKTLPIAPASETTALAVFSARHMPSEARKSKDVGAISPTPRCFCSLRAYSTCIKSAMTHGDSPPTGKPSF